MSTADPTPITPGPPGSGPPVPADQAVPEADAQEQRQPPEDGAAGTGENGPHELSERPVADTAEQLQVVAEEQVRLDLPRGDEVPEADWLEQSIEEPIDEEER